MNYRTRQSNLAKPEAALSGHQSRYFTHLIAGMGSLMDSFRTEMKSATVYDSATQMMANIESQMEI